MTRPLTILGLSTLLPLLAMGSTSAQAQTGTGGGPATTATAPNTSSVGRVMPPSRGAGEAMADDRRDRTARESQNDEVMRGICVGCSPK